MAVGAEGLGRQALVANSANVTVGEIGTPLRSTMRSPTSIPCLEPLAPGSTTATIKPVIEAPPVIQMPKWRESKMTRVTLTSCGGSSG